MNGPVASDAQRRNSPLLPANPLSLKRGLLFALTAVVSFHLSYLFPACAWCFGIFLYCLLRLTWLATGKQAARFGVCIGFAAYAPHLAFFWKIFGPGAIALWYVLSFWLGLFLLVGRACLVRFGPVVWALAMPFLWTGLEYFRSELYYLRFSWLNAGYAFSPGLVGFAAPFGTYGMGFVLMTLAAFCCTFAPETKAARRCLGPILLLVLLVPIFLPAFTSNRSPKSLNIVGIQLEGPNEGTVKSALDAALKKYPQTDLFVLSEYAFFGPLPEKFPAWCKAHGKWLVAGAEDPTSNDQYYNTVFVVGPDGKIAFRQAKCVPVQFMRDGLPAREQGVWDSPWGKLGFGICYDASYTRVMDELIRQGAEGLIFPTMDNADWGGAQHELHARIVPMRAAEYEVPVFRLCSSGISQFVESTGRVAATAPFPGQGAMLPAKMKLWHRGRMPVDRLLAKFSVAATGGLMLFLAIDAVLSRRRHT